MENSLYCQKHGDYLCLKEGGELIGLLPGTCKVMVDREVCTDCFTESKQGSN